MDLFANYEQEFVDTLSSLQTRLRNLASINTDQKLAEIKKADGEIRDAEDTLQSMNLNARNVSGPQGAKLQTRIKDYEAELAKVKKEIRRAESTAHESAARESLMGGSAVMREDMTTSLDQRERLLANNERLGKSNVHLKNARRQAEETIDVGAGIMSNLADQRQTMERGLNRLGEINDTLTRSGRLISAMARRVATNKLIMAIIMLVLIGAIVLIIWLGFFHNK